MNLADHGQHQNAETQDDLGPGQVNRHAFRAGESGVVLFIVRALISRGTFAGMSSEVLGAAERRSGR